jgi:GDP-L-fucose synthase
MIGLETDKVIAQKDQNTLKFKDKKIWITGHKGMLGSALVRSLQEEDANLLVATREELDLRDQNAVLRWVDKNSPDLVFHVGAAVGGIYANSSFRADFIRNNLLIQSNVIDAAYRINVQKLLFVASNCIYPANATQPIYEGALFSGPLEDNVRSYAVAKIAGVEMCSAYRKQYGCNFISIVPPNLYGPGDNYHPQHGHVVAGILRRAHEAKLARHQELVVWGDGTARREILYVDDLADAMKHLMATDVKDEMYNIGSSHDFSIAELARTITDIVGFKGKIVFDTSKPNGTMKKLLDSSRIRAAGWLPKINAKIGLTKAYEDLLAILDTSYGRL